MKVTCPACGMDITLDALLVHEEARRAVAAAMRASPALARRLMKYLGLFRPASRQLTMDRLASLLDELLPMIEAGSIDRRGRRWSGLRPEDWATALDVVLEHRDAGRLKLPLKSHGYLLEVLAGLADDLEARAEREQHARLARGERPAREKGAPVATGGPAPLAALLPPLPDAPAGPRQMPAQVRAELEALGLFRKAAREAGFEPPPAAEGEA